MFKDGTWIVDVCAERVCADPKIILPQIGLLAAFDGRRSGLGSAACDLKQNYSDTHEMVAFSFPSFIIP